MESSITASIKAYRLEAAVRFAAHRVQKATTTQNNELSNPQSTPQSFAYHRATIPGLEEYIQSAAAAYQKAKAWKKPKSWHIARALGQGEPVEHLHASLRREAWLRLCAERKHFVRVTHQTPLTDVLIPCGIPRDVLEQAASRFLIYRKSVQAIPQKPKSSGNVLGRRLVNESVGLLGIREDPAFCVHIKRCEDILVASGKVVLARMKEIDVTCDTFEDVSKRYAGRPDELYRRKTARKYATWRRRRLEEERILREHELNAEKEMKRRRGHDQLMTSRRTGDSSLAPFLYELSNNTYAYSSKITEAPKLRKIMLEKYNGSTNQNDPECNQWQRAQLAAQTNPLFHTRVMNRFS